MSVSIQTRDGTPKLCIDGKIVPPVLFGLSDFPGAGANTAYAQKNIAQFAQQGVHLVACDTDLLLGWHKTTPFEAEPLLSEVAGVLAADPAARVLVRLHVNPPYWWLRDHPEEQILYNGVPGIDDGGSSRLIAHDMDGHMRHSIASQKWLHDAGEVLKQFIHATNGTREGKAIFAIQIACGAYGEWHQWGSDTSAPMQRRFRQLLREKYGSDEALQAAWDDTTVTLDTAPFCPAPEQPGDVGYFRDPVRQRRIMDAQETIQRTNPEAILHFARIVKEHWGGDVLVGTFYGYNLGTAGDNAPVKGHLCAEMLYQAKGTIDFFAGPFPYYPEVRAYGGVPMQRGLLETLRLRGFLWLTEMDQHPFGTEDRVGGDPAQLPRTIAQLRRNALMPLLQGMGLWYYDHRIVPIVAKPNSQNPYCASLYYKFGWWDDPALLAEIQNIQVLAETCAAKPYAPAADVLVVYDLPSQYATAHSVENEVSVLNAIARSGAACDTIALSELELAEMQRYRLVILPNAYRLSDEQRALIREKCAGKHLLWLHAAGFSDEKTLRTENIAEITGIAIAQHAPPARSFTTCAPLPVETIEQTDIGLPQFCAVDPTAQPLAHFPDGAVAAARKGDSWYFSLNTLSPAILRHILTQSGAHRYFDSNECVLAGHNLILLSCTAGGERTLRLRNGKAIPHTLEPDCTAVFDAETGERIL